MLYINELQDFDEIARLVQESDGRTADVFAGDLVDPDVKGDIYSEAFEGDFRIFPFGKGLSEDRGLYILVTV